MIASAVIAAALTVGARAIALAPRVHPAWVVLDLPQDIDPGPNQRYDDLRIVDNRGNEVPYALDPDISYAPESDGALAATTRTTIDPQTKDTEIVLDLGHRNTRVTSLHVATTQREFDRYVRVETSDDGILWDEAGGSEIARYAHGSPLLDVPLSSATRLVRIDIVNQNNPPLCDVAATLYGPRHRVVFVAQPHTSYALDVAPGLDAAAYDTGDLLDHDDPHHFLRATATNEAPLQHMQRRFSEGWVLTIGFATAIATLLVVCIASLRYSLNGGVTKE